MVLESDNNNDCTDLLEQDDDYIRGCI